MDHDQVQDRASDSGDARRKGAKDDTFKGFEMRAMVGFVEPPVHRERQAGTAEPQFILVTCGGGARHVANPYPTNKLLTYRDQIGEERSTDTGSFGFLRTETTEALTSLPNRCAPR
jgi:hypothetical protein